MLSQDEKYAVTNLRRGLADLERLLWVLRQKPHQNEAAIEALRGIGQGLDWNLQTFPAEQ